MRAPTTNPTAKTEGATSAWMDGSPAPYLPACLAWSGSMHLLLHLWWNLAIAKRMVPLYFLRFVLKRNDNINILRGGWFNNTSI